MWIMIFIKTFKKINSKLPSLKVLMLNLEMWILYVVALKHGNNSNDLHMP